ncbi:MAG: hypothetical protein D6782_11350 [Alphaproteobacteria bacterium]|nr:MAG: hypothetical protein D6782_11350 [Alphaproteobacteria bacterium]
MCIRTFIACIACTIGLMASLPAAAASAKPTPSQVREWVATWGDQWYERYHPDYDAQYPGGRSNRYHDQWVAYVFKLTDGPSNTDWQILNKRYAYDGDWFVVEWLFQAQDKRTGKLQREGTLAFGRIADDRLITWIEYFDGFVAHMQRLGALPLFGPEEEPFPWPADTHAAMDYRP